MIDPGKQWRIRIYDRDWQYLGDWPNQNTVPAFRSEMNNYNASMTLDLAENDETGMSNLRRLITQSGRQLLTQKILLDSISDGYVLLDDGDDRLLLDGDDILQLQTRDTADARPYEVNDRDFSFIEELLDQYFNVEVAVQHTVGAAVGNEVLQANDGTPILTDDGQEIEILRGGRPVPIAGGADEQVIFKGFITRTDLNVSGQGMVAHVRSYGQRLDDFYLQGDDLVVLDHNSGSDTRIRIGQNDTQMVVQQLEATERVRIDAVDIAMSFNAREYQESVLSTSHQIFITSEKPVDPSSIGSRLVSATYNQDITPVKTNYQLQLGRSVILEPGTYYVVILPSTQFNYSIYATDTPLENGQLSIYSGGRLSVLDTNLQFSLLGFRFNTDIQFTDTKPSDIFKWVLNRVESQVGHIRAGIIEDTGEGTEIDLNLKNLTASQALKKALEVCPPEFYSYHDFGTGEIHLRRRTETWDRLIIPSEHLDPAGKIIATSEKLINKVFFVGGAIGGVTQYWVFENPNPAQFGREIRHTDNRVIRRSTAERISARIFEDSSQSLRSGSFTVNDNKQFNTEDIRVGEVWQLTAQGAYVDRFKTQVRSIDYKPHSSSVTTGYIPPRISDRPINTALRVDELADIDTPDTAML